MKILELVSSTSEGQSLLKELVTRLAFLSDVIVVQKNIEDISDLSSSLSHEGFTGCCLSLDVGAQFQHFFSQRPQSVQDLEAFDFLYRASDGVFWPLLLLSSKLKSALAQQIDHLDLNGVGYVVGSNKMASCAVATLIHLGMKKIRWVIGEDEFLPPDFDKIRKKFFGVQMELINSSKLISQNVDGSLLLSTMDYLSRPEVLQDICYFNFIKQESFVCDLFFPTRINDFSKSPLLREAREAGLPIFRSELLAAEIYLDFLSRFRAFSSDEAAQMRNVFKLD